MTRRLAGLLLLTTLAVLARPLDAAAVVSFEAPRVFGLLSNPCCLPNVQDVATDGAGTWIVAAPIGPADSDIGYVRSTDGAATWSALTQLNDELATGIGPDTSPQFAGDGSGNWVAIWSFSDGSPFYDFDPLVVRSSDNGASWSAPAPLEPTTAQLELAFDVATDGSGTWIATWTRQDLSMSAPVGVYVSRSTDDGATWSSTLVGTGDYPADRLPIPALATDRAGTWVVVWRAPGPGGDLDAAYATSVDGGLTWSAPAFLSSNAATDGADDGRVVDVAADSAGNWLAVWGVAGDIFGARSTDGLSWTAAAQIDEPSMEAGIDRHPFVATSGGGEWVVAWFAEHPVLGTYDDDALYARSQDGGVTWAPPASVNQDATHDNRPFGVNNSYENDVPFGLEADASGTWVAGYSASYTASIPDCPTAPPTTCKQTLTPRAAQITLLEKPVASDILTWKWKGESTDPFDLGNPVLSSSAGYVLCVYDEIAGVPELVLEKDIEAGGTCGTDPCWKSTSTGLRYRDPKHARGAVTRLDVRSGADRRARVSGRAAGFAVTPPFMPLANDTVVRVQLHNLETTTCWEGEFSAPAKNDALRYRAVSE